MTKIGYIFPGQGSQKVGMGKELWDASDEVKALFQKANQVLNKDITKICFEGPQEELTKTENAQPAIFLVSAAVLIFLKEAGFTPTCVAGHSLGEITAYYAAGVINLDQALQIIKKRGEGMAASYPSEKSGMAAIMGMEKSVLEDVLAPFKEDPLVCANDNCPGQIVISGEKDSLQKAIPLIKEKGGKAIPLPVSGAFHSPLMSSGSDRLKTFLNDGFTFNSPSCPIILNRSAAKEEAPAALLDNLPLQVISQVRWTESMNALSEDVDIIFECGPGRVLTGLMRKINAEVNVKTLSNLEQVQGVINEC